MSMCIKCHHTVPDPYSAVVFLRDTSFALISFYKSSPPYHG